MNISPKSVRFDDYNMWVTLSDARTLAVPLAWFPRLMHASPEQRAEFELSAWGVHWDKLNEDVSVEGLIAGCSDVTQHG